MHPGCPPGSAPGAIEDIITDLEWSWVTGTTMLVAFFVKPRYRNRFFAIFINGIYTGRNYKCDNSGWIERAFIVDPGTTNASVFIEDAGGYAVMSDAPSGYAEAEEIVSGNRIQEVWQSEFSQSTIKGDSQLSAVTITGASRGKNVSSVNGFLHRGELTYSILNVGGTYIVRWYAGVNLVAEGSRVGNGALTCSEINGSGLSIVCTITYTADVKPSVAFIQLLWPKEYQLHYSTAALTFPRTPEKTIPDRGIDDVSAYRFQTPVLASGTYHYALVAVAENGVLESVPIVTGTKTISAAPLQPTNLSATISALAAHLTWNVGEAGCTFDIYYSLENEPINFGSFLLPAPVTTALNATSATVPIGTYGSSNRQTIYNTLVTAFDAAISAANGNFNSVNFSAAIDTLLSDLTAALATYATALPRSMTDFLENITATLTNLSSTVDQIPSGYSAGQWADAAGKPYAKFLMWLGQLLNHESGRYALPNGAIGGGAAGSAVLGTGVNEFDESGIAMDIISTTLRDCAEPLTENSKYRFVVRATKGGIQETNHDTLTIEIDDSGSAILARPNPAQIKTIETQYVGNAFLYSEALDNAAWTKSGVAVTANAVANPIDGTVNADFVHESNSSNTTHSFYQTINLSIGTHAISIYAKMNGRRYLDVIVNAATTKRAKFDLQSGAVQVSTGVTASIESVGSGWYRCKVIVVGDATSAASGYVTFQPNSSATLFSNSYTGSAATGYYGFGAQLESSVSVNTYIKTSGVAVVNNILTVDGFVETMNVESDATYFDLYVVAAANPPGSTIDLTVASASAAVEADVLGADIGEVTYKITAAGWYDIYLASRDAASVREIFDYKKVKTIYVSISEPNSAQSFTAKVARGRGALLG